MNSKCILVTGAAGFIGSHTCLNLLEKGVKIVAVDNLVNSKIDSIKRVEKITGKSIDFYNVDLNDSYSLRKIFQEVSVDGVIHFAGYKAVGESVNQPIMYYRNNVSATINLLHLMQEYVVNKIVFSSSCTVYGDPIDVPVKENSELKPTNPYGRSKLMVEKILRDYFLSNDNFSASILRYFNPIGAHSSGLIGEDPTGTPNNLLPYITKVANGELNELKIFGNDYDTSDGTGVRDYVHVMDIANAHVKALEESLKNKRLFEIYNLGTGKGYSVLEVLKMFEEVSGKEIPFTIVDRRAGDVAKTFANPEKVNQKLNWYANKSLKEMCYDTWNWQIKNPNGYN